MLGGKVSPEDNWTCKLLYVNGTDGSISFAVLIRATADFILTLENRFNDEQSYRTIKKPRWLLTHCRFHHKD